MKRNIIVLLVAAAVISTVSSSSYASDEDIAEKFSLASSQIRAETEHAVIYSHEEVQVPGFLTSDFDRVFEMVASYFSLEAKDEKLTVWVVDFETLQEMYPGQKGYPGGTPNTVAALYAPGLNSFFFTPQYLNDYYVAHELIHHFIDEYSEKIALNLPEVIISQNTNNLPLDSFISLNEEKIAFELPQIIIRKNLASFALQGV